MDSPVHPGVVGLREDIPLKAGTDLGERSGQRCCGGGPKFILACFAALSAGITLALLTQIYYGDYEVVPHGAVSSSEASCSQAGTETLKAGGGALDAAVASAVCLAIMAPHRTSLDACGSMLYWEYRTAYAQAPTLAEWGGPDALNTTLAERPPKLLSALASLHAKHGVLPWAKLLQPAINIARTGFLISNGLSMAATEQGDTVLVPATLRTSPVLADYLEKLQVNSSSDLAKAWGSDGIVKYSIPPAMLAGDWKVFAGGAGATVAGDALAVALHTPLPEPDAVFHTVVNELQQAALQSTGWPPFGVASGLAAVDRYDNYVALVTGLSKPFGSGPATQDGWTRDQPTSPLDLAPAMIVDEHACGTRYIVGAESSSALAQGAAALLTTALGARAVERARVSVFPGGVFAIEAMRDPPSALPPAPLVNSTQPYAAVNVVQQRADALQSHADSRGGGISFRF